MNDTLDVIKTNNEQLANLKSVLKKHLQNNLSPEQIANVLIPGIRFFDQVGAVALFHKALVSLDGKYDDNVEYQICKMLDCYENFDYTGMAYWLQQIATHPDLTSEQRAVVAINTIFANENGGCFDNYVEKATKELETLICDEHYLTYEGMENLMQELETKDIERLNKYISFLDNYQCADWKEYNWITNVIFNHYRRTNNYVELKNIIRRFTDGINKFELTEIQRLKAEIYYLRLLFECRYGNWEEYSIYIFKNHEKYLSTDIEVRYYFIREFFAIINDSAQVYGRYLNGELITEVALAINTSLNDFIPRHQQFEESFEPELLHSRRFWIELRKEQLHTESILNNYDVDTYLSKLKKIQANTLNLCKINQNRREYLRWLLCFTDELFAFSENININDQLRSKAEQLQEIFKEAEYSASISYYFIFTANIWDYLGEEGKSKELLNRFNQSGANIKAYNLNIQRLYRKLEDKYRLLPPDERHELLDVIDLLTDLNSKREIQESLIRAEKHFKSLDLSDKNYVAYVGPENIARFLLKCAHIFLNANRFDLFDLIWDKVNALNADWVMKPDMKAELDINHAVGLFREGRFDEAYSLMEHWQGENIHDVLKLRALIVMGDIEAEKSWPQFKLNSLSKALGLAERLGIQSEIARIYHKLGKFFGPYYPALGLSFLRKCETIFENLGLIDDLYEICLLRAQASMFIHLVYSERYKFNTRPLFEEAKRLLDRYPRHVFKNEASRAFHDRISGIIYCDIEKLNAAYLFYSRVGAYNDMKLALESAIITFSLNGMNDKALVMANEYLKIVSERHDTICIHHANEMIYHLRQADGSVGFPYGKNPYAETTLLDILDDISFEEEIWALDDSFTRKHFPYPCDEGKCLPLKDGKTVTLSPVCLIPFTYYRGQSQRHQPCRPTYYRSNMTASSQFIERLKFCEFYLLLETHPLCSKFKNSFKYKYPDGSEETLNFNVYHLALAQHYGIATELMDVTSDKWIAAFFAATKWDDNIYSPFNEDGWGIFYTCKEKHTSAPSIRPIGIQPFSRPAEQRGYALPMSKDDDFEENASIRMFKHYPEINEFIFNYTNRSLKLFPHDILKDKADIIIKSHSFSKAAYDMAVLNLYPTTKPEILAEWMDKEKVNIVPDPLVEFSADDMEEYRRNLPMLFDYIQKNIVVLNLGLTSPDGVDILYSVR